MINFHNTHKALVTLSRQDVGCNFLYVQTDIYVDLVSYPYGISYHIFWHFAYQ